MNAEKANIQELLNRKNQKIKLMDNEKGKSDVWQHFYRITHDEPTNLVACKR